jgi:hypothetical protein
MTEGISNPCPWCERPFRPRRGGSPQRFCQSKCRVAFWSALRRWSERAIDLGILTIDDIRSGDPAACTLLLEAASRAPVAAPPWQDHPVPELPRVASLYTPQDELEAAMAGAIAIRRR